MERVLVTGGAGFAGANFVHHLATHTDARVTVLDKLTYAASTEALVGLPDSRVRLVPGDIIHPEIVQPLVAMHDAVVHFAAESHTDNALSEPAPFVQTNLVGTFNVLEAVRRTGARFHHVSTDEVYGDLGTADPQAGDPPRFTEQSAYDPGNPYAATKAGSDHLVRAWIRSFGVRGTITTAPNLYGPWQHVEKFISRQITTLIDGGRPKVYGAGCHVRDWLHADDHAAAVLAVLQRGRIGETYLVGADSERTNLEVVRTLLRLFGRDPDDYDSVPDRVGHDLRYAVDAAKLRRELGWEPRCKVFEDGLAETVAWYRSHDSWWRRRKLAAEAAYAEVGRGVAL